jgi:uncharacterized protein DUF3303
MVIEHFRGGDARPVYRRFRDAGRLMPDSIAYVASWVDADLTRCFQVMECADEASLAQWTAQWSDIVDFEIVPVITSAQARAKIEPLL